MWSRSGNDRTQLAFFWPRQPKYPKYAKSNMNHLSIDITQLVHRVTDLAGAIFSTWTVVSAWSGSGLQQICALGLK